MYIFIVMICRKVMFCLFFTVSTLIVLFQACSQAQVSGLAKLSQSNHVVRTQRAYFILLYVSTIKWLMCVQGKIEKKVKPGQNFRRFIPVYEDKASMNIANRFLGVAKSWHAVAQ